MATIEFVSGTESHTSRWGKFYIRGLEKWQIREDFEANCHDRHHNYQGYTCLNIPDNQIFTIFQQSGTKAGTDEMYFAICLVSSGFKKIRTIECYGRGFCEGNFEIIAIGETKTKALRLLSWWDEYQGEKNLEFAQHCAKHIDIRGLKELPSMQ